MGNFHHNYEYFAQKKITECKNEPKKSNNKSLLIQGKNNNNYALQNCTQLPIYLCL